VASTSGVVPAANASGCATTLASRQGVGYRNYQAYNTGAGVSVSVESAATCGSGATYVELHSYSSPIYTSGGYRRVAGEQTKPFSNVAYYNSAGQYQYILDLGCTVPDNYSVRIEPAHDSSAPQYWAYQALASNGCGALASPMVNVPFVHQDYFFETATYKESDIPGRTSDHNNWRQAQQYQDTYAVDPQPYPCGMSGYNDNPTRWTRAALSCTGWDMWTQ